MPVQTISTSIATSVTLGNGIYSAGLTVTSTGTVAPSLAGAASFIMPRAGLQLHNFGGIEAAAGNAGTVSVTAGLGGIGVDITGAGVIANHALITGGAGGAGYTSYDGGTGGDGVALAAGGTLINHGTLQAGAGGDGAGGDNGSPGGNGGAGGTGLAFSGDGTAANSGIIAGGAGGSANYQGGGGMGGSGAIQSGSGTLTNSGTIKGGDGGGGGLFDLQGGAGGTGGDGLILTTGSIAANGGFIVGGNGGNGGGSDFGLGGAGGTGGDGLALYTAATAANGGEIAGGAGGAGNYGGVGGVGGIALALMAGGTAVNSATLTGGEGGTGSGGGGSGGYAAHGGAGGAGLLLAAGGTAANDGAITGGAGGTGGSPPQPPGIYYGVGGTGGTALALNTGGYAVNLGTLTGGAGGTGGLGSTGGVGGNALVLAAGATGANDGVIAGGTGGTYGTAIYGAIPNGSSGGAGAYLNGGVLLNSGTIEGGAGSNGAFSWEGGEGGNGGDGVRLASGSIAANGGFIIGGSGGSGGGSDGTFGRRGGAGGTGGIGLAIYASVTTANSGEIAGGTAGAGTYGGIGGAGGIGVALMAGGTITNSGTLTGGTGGAGGLVAQGGAGGIGLVLSNSATASNTSLITGGTGGTGGGAVYGTGPDGGSGGAGVYLNGSVLFDSGTISGGAGGAGGAGNPARFANGNTGTQGDAVLFGSTAGTLAVESGAVFNGSIVANATVADVLELTGTSTSALSGIGTQFENFDTLDFAAGAQWTIAGNTAGLASGETITGFTLGDAIILDGFSASSNTYISGTGLILSNATASETLGLTFPPHGFSITEKDGNTEINAACFCRGTRIATPRGGKAVEQLAIGDIVTTDLGTAPIKWIGRRDYDGAFIAGSHLALPIKIRRHALGRNVPSRDVFLSPDHGICEGGVFIPAWRLLNGVSITQRESVERVEYFHIELETPAVIFAENMPVESFVDADCRQRFQNAAEFASLYPNAPKTQKPCRPRIEDGFLLQRIQTRINARAGLKPAAETTGPLRGNIDTTTPRLTGWAQDTSAPETPVTLEILHNGTVIGHIIANRYREDLRAAGLGSGCHAFDLPALPTPLTLRRPTDGATLAAPETRAA